MASPTEEQYRRAGELYNELVGSTSPDNATQLFNNILAHVLSGASNTDIMVEFRSTYPDISAQTSPLGGITEAAPTQTTQSAPVGDAWQENFNRTKDFYQAGTFIGGTQTAASFQLPDGSINTFALSPDGSVDYTRPIASLTEEQQLDNDYRRLQIAKLMGDLGGGGGSGGAGRTQFESESRLQSAQAAQIEQAIALAAQGGQRLVNIGGMLFDPATGQTIDPSTYGVSRFNADTGRMSSTTDRDLANFQMGPAFDEQRRQFDARLGLDTSAESRMNASAQSDSAIGFGKLGVDRAEFERQVLSNPADVLYRLAAQRGGQSPTDRISMADILNAFRQQPGNINNAVTSKFAPPVAGLPAPRLPVPIVPQPVAPAPTASPYPTSRINPEGQIVNYTDWGAQAAVEDQPETPFNDPAVTATVNDLNDAANAMGGWGAPGTDATEGIREIERAMGLARGGFVQDSRFIVGDQRSGKPTGHEEMVINPTNAPLAVVPNNALGGMSRFAKGKVNKYDEGTMSAGDIRPQELDARPTGGFLNSLEEVGRGAGNAVAGAGVEGISRLIADMQADPAAFGTVAAGNVIRPTSINAQAMPKNWGPMEIQKYQQNVKMENLQTGKRMYDNAIDRADKLSKLAEKTMGDKGMRLSRMADRAYERINELYEYTNALESDIMAPANFRGAVGPEAIKHRIRGKSLTDSMQKALSGEDLTGYATGTGLFDTTPITQPELIDLSRKATSPGGTSVLSGQMPSRFRIPGLQTPTAMQFGSLSGAEKENLRPRLAAEFDSTLEDLMFDIQQRYSTGPSRLARFRG